MYSQYVRLWRNEVNGMNRKIGFAAIFIVATAQAADLPVSTPSHQGLPLLVAEQMIDACVQLSASEKFPALSVVVIDISGTMVAFRRQDGAMPVSSDAALLKAKTALRVRMSSGALGALAVKDPLIRDMLLELQLTGISGGSPITTPAGDVIGAVGVSGGAPLEDGRCATAAAAAVGGRPAG